MLLEIEGLKKVFTDGTAALRGVDLSIHKGEFVVVLGPSGSGKTTLLRSINGLVQPDEGTIRFCGTSVHPDGLALLRKKTGTVFQDFNLVDNLSSINNVLSGLLDSSNRFLSLFYHFTREQKLVAMGCLDRVGLIEKAYTDINQLSGGQKQRVGIARAIAKRPALLLADEPIASLDPLTARAIMQLLRDIAHEYGITVICNLHQVDIALNFSDRMVGISNGHLVMDKKTGDVDEDYIKEIYGGYGRGLHFTSRTDPD